MENKLPNINSNTGHFINGNPATGTLGTIVTAEWLNGVQDRMQDVFEELRNVLLLGNLQPDGQRQNQVAEAIKAYCNNINLKVQSNTRNFDNYIPNSKKSNAVNSNSADTVATSVAVKTANDNANGRVSKAGDTMTGDLIVPYLKTTGNYLSVTANNADFAGLDIIREGRLGNWLARMEAMPDKKWKFWTENGYELYLPARSGTVALEHEVVPRNGDTTINGRHFFRNEQSWIGIVSTGTESSGIDFANYDGRHAQCSIQAVDIGNYADELRFFTTPQGQNYDTDRRQHTMTINPDGYIWTKAYGWLGDAFCRPAKHTFYNNHYNGAEVWKIPVGNGNCLMITTMNVYLNSNNETFFLPERYTGWATPMAVDVGSGRYAVGISIAEIAAAMAASARRYQGS